MCVYVHICEDVHTYTLGEHAWAGGGGCRGGQRPMLSIFNGFLSYFLRLSLTEHGWPWESTCLSLLRLQIRCDFYMDSKYDLHSKHLTISSAPGSIFLSWKSKAIPNILPLTKHGHSSHLPGQNSLGISPLRYLIALLDGLGGDDRRLTPYMGVIHQTWGQCTSGTFLNSPKSELLKISVC